MWIYILGKIIFIEFVLLFDYIDEQLSKNHELVLEWNLILFNLFIGVKSIKFKPKTVWLMLTMSLKVLNILWLILIVLKKDFEMPEKEFKATYYLKSKLKG